MKMKKTKKRTGSDSVKDNTTEFSINFKHSSSDGQPSWIAPLGALLVICLFLWQMFGVIMG
jgi:hypothetical protein